MEGKGYLFSSSGEHLAPKVLVMEKKSRDPRGSGEEVLAQG